MTAKKSSQDSTKTVRLEDVVATDRDLIRTLAHEAIQEALEQEMTDSHRQQPASEWATLRVAGGNILLACECVGRSSFV